MHFGIHTPADSEAEANDQFNGDLDLGLMADHSQSSARIVHSHAQRNGFDTEVYSFVTGVYGVPREELSESEAGNASFPDKVLDLDTIHELHSFVEDVRADIEQKYDIQSLKKQVRNSAPEESRADLFDAETREAYRAYVYLTTIRKATKTAIDHNVQLYYGEGDVDR